MVDGGELTISLQKMQPSETTIQTARQATGHECLTVWQLVIQNDKPEQSIASDGHQVSLPNIAMRLEAIFSTDATLQCQQTANQFSVTIGLPEYNDQTVQ